MKLRGALLLSLLLLPACKMPVTQAPTPTTASVPAELRSVTFTSQDGITLSGTLHGSGTTAIIFSHMSDGDRTDWRDLPAQMAGMGYMTLAFDFRGRGESQGSFDPPSADKDLLAATAFARGEGASKVVLAGASMGAMASAKVAAVEEPAALLFLAGTTSWSGLTVTQGELQTGTAKLFISSEGDNYIVGTLHLYEWANPPKEKHIYPGSAHGTDLFDTHGDDLTRRITAFVATHAPP